MAAVALAAVLQALLVEHREKTVHGNVICGAARIFFCRRLQARVFNPDPIEQLGLVQIHVQLAEPEFPFEAVGRRTCFRVSAFLTERRADVRRSPRLPQDGRAGRRSGEFPFPGFRCTRICCYVVAGVRV